MVALSVRKFPFLEVSPRIRVGLNGKTLFVKKVTEILRD